MTSRNNMAKPTTEEQADGALSWLSEKANSFLGLFSHRAENSPAPQEDKKTLAKNKIKKKKETDVFCVQMEEICVELDFMTETQKSMRGRTKQEIEKLKENSLYQKIKQNKMESSKKMADKNVLFKPSKTRIELSNAFSNLVASYPVYSKNECTDILAFTELKKAHHQLVCDAFSAYIEECEREDALEAKKEKERAEEKLIELN